MVEEKSPFIAYEYLNIPVKQSMENLYIDCNKSFGWQMEGMAVTLKPDVSELKLKRNRKINNREELKKLQNEFEIALHKLERMELSKTLKGTSIALAAGIAGAALLIGGFFAYSAESIWLCIILFILGGLGCIFPYFAYKRIMKEQESKVKEEIEIQYDIIHGFCERANSLINEAEKSAD